MNCPFTDRPCATAAQGWDPDACMDAGCPELLPSDDDQPDRPDDQDDQDDQDDPRRGPAAYEDWEIPY